jgi:acyl-CoA thioesterase-1
MADLALARRPDARRRPSRIRPRRVVLVLAILAACVTGAPADTRSPTASRVLTPAATGSLSYVALGDSTVEGVGASALRLNYVSRLHERLRGVFPAAQMVNLGVGGATADDVRRHQLPQAVRLRPDLVTLSVGPNDITGRRPLADYRRDVEEILRTLAGQTTAVVVVNLIPDLGVTPRFRGKDVEERVRQRVLAFNEALGHAARAHGAEIVDLYGPSQREVPRRPELIAADSYHPSDEGYARWAELMWAGIEARIRR